jgi:hypothetical protein
VGSKRLNNLVLSVKLLKEELEGYSVLLSSKRQFLNNQVDYLEIKDKHLAHFLANRRIKFKILNLKLQELWVQVDAFLNNNSSNLLDFLIVSSNHNNKYSSNKHKLLFNHLKLKSLWC